MLVRVPTIVLVAALVTMLVPGAVRPRIADVQTPDADALLALERRIGAADLHPDRATAAFLESTIADDYVLTGASGRRLGKREAIRRWTVPDAASRPVASALHGVRMVMAPDAAYVTAISTETERRANGDTTFRLRVTDVWARRADRWRLVAGHVSRVPLASDPGDTMQVRHVAVDRAGADDRSAIVGEYGATTGLSRAARAARYDSSMTDDFASALRSGVLSGKAATIARWTPAPRADGLPPDGRWSAVSDVQVRTFGGLAVVTLTDTEYDSTGRVEGVVHTTDVRRKEGGRWKLAALQASTCSPLVRATEDSMRVAAAEQAIVRASAAGDRAALDTLIDSTFLGTVRTGRSFGKRAAIAHWAAPDTSGERSVLERIVVRPFDGGAFVDLLDAQVARDGRRLRASRAVDLWVRRGPRWLLAAGHALPENAPTDAAAIAAVRGARDRLNAATAARDTTAVRALLADSVAQASPAFRRTGADAYVALLARVLARRPDLALRFTPERVEAGADAAFERGRWEESWREGGDPTTLAGEYHAIWRRDAAGWKLAAELFAPTTCTGTTYCK